ncbi:MAG: hypothetical protein RBS09_09655 [Anaerolineaceae bacterium]|jgi:hypothetical protein|nr:hypothetical protein [Anaerolineaceae bacterium]
MRPLLLSLLLVATVARADNGLMRVWTAGSGKKVKAEMVRMDGQRVVLKSLDGKEIGINASSLTKHDQTYLSFFNDFRTKNYDGTGPKVPELKNDVPIDKCIHFLKWKFQDAVQNSNIVYELIFMGKGQENAYWLSPIPAINIATLNANIIDFQKEAVPQWFTCSRRTEIEQVEDNLYETRLYSRDFKSIRAYFSKTDFNAIRDIPEDSMLNGHGDITYYVYGSAGKRDYSDCLFLGALASEKASDNKKGGTYTLDPNVRTELEKMNDTNWKDIRDKLLDTE